MTTIPHFCLLPRRLSFFERGAHGFVGLRYYRALCPRFPALSTQGSACRPHFNIRPVIMPCRAVGHVGVDYSCRVVFSKKLNFIDTSVKLSPHRQFCCPVCLISRTLSVYKSPFPPILETSPMNRRHFEFSDSSPGSMLGDRFELTVRSS